MGRGTEPTCKEEGVVAHYHCEYCGKNFDSNYGEIETISIPKAEHEYGSMYRGKSANFWENGNIEYAPSHMQMRKLFGSAKFVVDVSEVERKNPYNEFEQLAVRNGWKKDYSLHRLPHDNVQPLVDILRGAAKEYICY